MCAVAAAPTASSVLQSASRLQSGQARGRLRKAYTLWWHLSSRDKKGSGGFPARVELYMFESAVEIRALKRFISSRRPRFERMAL